MEGESNFISQSSTLYCLSSIFLTGTLQSQFRSVPEGDKVYSKPTHLSKVLKGLNVFKSPKLQLSVGFTGFT